MRCDVLIVLSEGARTFFEAVLATHRIREKKDKKATLFFFGLVAVNDSVTAPLKQTDGTLVQ